MRTHCKHGHEWIAENLRLHHGRLCCKVCHRERERARYHSDVDGYRARAREYARTHPAENAARAKAWRKANPERAAEQSRYHTWIRNFARNSKTAEYISILKLDPCSYCGGPAGTIDHIVAKSRGGSNDWDNLTACCKSCNSSKRARNVLGYMLVTS